ncbi:DNA repair protein RecO [Rhodobacterales bacterium HTCC2150]|mgnify:FL=1|nr:DNA repair protein RecO [Rhodobacterales bacterium HTCC2150] [Rhodobacteraceae bacterium HTCC2150]
MEWRDQGAIISVRHHGETSAIVEVFTKNQGRHAGVVRGATSRKIAPFLQPGGQVDVSWRARLNEHLGTFTIEPIQSRAHVMSNPLALAGLNAVCALLQFTLPERESHPRLYETSIALLDSISETSDWPLDYLHWEMLLLDDLGFGLDLSECAVTGTQGDLAYVSPKSGRAVSKSGAGEWADRLLPLTPCLISDASVGVTELIEGLRTTGHFLENHLAPELGNRPLPEARARMIDRLGRLRTRTLK